MNYRQGDVYLLKVNTISQKLKKCPEKILAYGEVTGHKHVLKPYSNDCKIEVVENGDGCYVRIRGSAIVEHEEHEHIIIPEGGYEVRIQREYDPISYARKVAD